MLLRDSQQSISGDFVEVAGVSVGVGAGVVPGVGSQAAREVTRFLRED